jgi:hypothetical protein
MTCFCDQIHMIAKFKFHSNIIFLLIHDKWKCIYDTDLLINGSFNIPCVVLQLYSRREVWNKNQYFWEIDVALPTVKDEIMNTIGNVCYQWATNNQPKYIWKLADAVIYFYMQVKLTDSKVFRRRTDNVVDKR